MPWELSFGSCSALWALDPGALQLLKETFLRRGTIQSEAVFSSSCCKCLHLTGDTP